MTQIVCLGPFLPLAEKKPFVEEQRFEPLEILYNSYIVMGHPKERVTVSETLTHTAVAALANSYVVESPVFPREYKHLIPGRRQGQLIVLPPLIT